MDIKTIRFLALLGSFLIVSILIMPTAVAIPVPTVEINGVGVGVCDPAGCVGSHTETGIYDASWSFTLNPDPSITGNFTLTNLSSSTQTFILTVTMPIAPLGPSLSINGFVATDPGLIIPAGVLSDLSGNGATLKTDPISLDPMYSALIDGVSVEQLLDAPQAFNIKSSDLGLPTTLNFGPASFGPNILAQSASSSIGMRLEFNLSAGDQVFLPEFIEVQPAGTGQVPEPTTLALLGVALAGMGFARRRKLN